MAVFEALGQITYQNWLFGGGMLTALIAIVIGLSRSLSKEHQMFMLGINMFSWIIAIVLLPTRFLESLTLFAIGTFGLIIAFMDEIDKFGEGDLWKTAFTVIVLNLVLTSAFFIHDVQNGYPSDLSTSTVNGQMNEWIQITEARQNNMTQSYLGNTVDNINPDTYDQEFSAHGDYSLGYYDILQTAFSMAKWATLTLKFIVMFFFLPIILYNEFGVLITINPVIGYIISIIANILCMQFIAQIIHFILNKRGKGTG